jgi:hypothetical protein
MMSTLYLHVRQLVLAFLLALLVVPLADRLAPDHSNETRAEVPDDLDTIVQAHVTTEAKKYNVPAPLLRFVSFRAPGVTMRSTEPDDKGQILIRLGAVMQTPLYAAHPEWVKAVAGHEFGHAVMMERNQAFNNALVFLLYAVGLAPFIFGFRKKRSKALAAAGMTLTLAFLVVVRPSFTINDAFLSLIGILVIASIFYWYASAKKASIESPAAAPPYAQFLPDRGLFLTGSVVGTLLFGASFYAIGSQNVIYELRGDVIGACSTSPATMMDAITHLSGKPTPVIEDDITDTFHPRMTERVAILEEMKNPEVLDRACQAVLNGNSPLIIAGHAIQ